MDGSMKDLGTIQRHTISVIVDNEAGVLARVTGLFSGRGYNIESLTVAALNDKARRSRVTIVTRGTQNVIEQIKAQLDRLIPVHRVSDLTMDAPLYHVNWHWLKWWAQARSGLKLCALLMPFVRAWSTAPLTVLYLS